MQKVRKLFCRRIFLERKAIESYSLVFETKKTFGLIQSSIGHVKSCVKIAGPSAKAKYIKTPIVDLVP